MALAVRRAMIALFIVDIIINLFVMVRMAPELADNTFLAPPGLPIYGCLTMPKNVLPSVIAWIPCIVITVILFMMMAFKLFRPESLRLRRKDDNQPPHSPLVDAFFKDTALYFLVVLFMVTAGFVMTFTAKGPYTVLSLPWTLLTYSFAGSRLILRIREKAALSMANDSLPGGNSVQVARFVNPHAQDTQADSEFAEPEHCPSRSRSSPPVSDDHGIHVIPICRIISVPNSKSTPTPPNPP
ncbi:hypothetical protein BJ165DRAFT_1474565 [Panaeolus papilionaceus]|nr:hypothetical protein BJ165DRAFT_1474565 [Panaeolus papilionaceus]